MTTSTYPRPQGDLPLPLTFLPAPTRRALIVGVNKLAAARAFTFLDSSFGVVLLGDRREACDELVWREGHGEVVFHTDVDEDGDDETSRRWSEETDVEAWTRLISSIDSVDMVVVADTILTPTSSSPRPLLSARSIFHACTRLHLPINTTDYPAWSTFTFPSVAKFPGKEPGTKSNLQIAVSTNGKGCRLAGRIRREVVGRLPKDVGAAVDNVGILRARVRARSPGSGSTRSGSCTRGKRQDGAAAPTSRPVNGRTDSGFLGDDDDVSLFSGSGPLNSPVPQLGSPALSRTSSTRSLFHPQVQLVTQMHQHHHQQQQKQTADSYPFPSVLTPLPISPAITAKTAPSTASTTQMDEEDHQLRRMRWVSQISEYWSIEYLARMGEEEMERCLEMWTEGGEADRVDVGEMGQERTGSGVGTINGSSDTSRGRTVGTGAGAAGDDTTPTGETGLQLTPRHGLALDAPPRPPAPRRGKILLLGSGPGHPSLLTVAAHQALLTATLILSDKLVPAEILALIPKTTTLHIAKKFPGNAEGAQNEMMQLALEGALKGETVVRLKQGDPFVYGRGGEEVLFFREHGFESVVVPGISSSIAGPLMMGIPVTQRGVADSMVLCTGVGRKGKAVQLPGYVRGRTLIVLMGVARIHQVLQVLTNTNLNDDPVARETTGWRDGDAFPPHLPIAIIERASSHDQRMVASTLDKIEDALERSGEQRPPGMMIIGWAALALEGEGEVTVLDDDEDTPDLEARDKARVERWLGGQDYILKDGLRDEWAQFLPPGAVTEVE